MIDTMYVDCTDCGEEIDELHANTFGECPDCDTIDQGAPEDWEFEDGMWD
jgi:predicted RNA-binding Zn-ribbon protein involved in translation (DUF1610 family)